jgi:hypothetical protein
MIFHMSSPDLTPSAAILPNIAAPRTTASECDLGKTTGMLHVSAKSCIITTFFACPPDIYRDVMSCPAVLRASTMCRV